MFTKSAAWSRRYPPLVVLAGAIVLAIFTLPSALTLPQASPAETLEYAPVPPNSNAPPGGNFAGLGLGSSSTLGANGVGGLLLPPPALGQNPSSKQCVGSPPRQTEDPLSPPCVAFFNGDNGGSTYPGVTRSEIRIVVYLEGGRTSVNNSHGSDTTPTNALYDLWTAAGPGEDMYVQWLRVWQAYFADRYQTYNRKPHFYVYFNGGQDTVAAVRADASLNYARIHPFAVLAYGDYANAYESYMAQHGVLSFGGGVGNMSGALQTSAFYSAYPSLIWGFDPSADIAAQIFSSFVCAKVAPFPASVSGNSGENGKPRRYGLIYSADPSQPGLTYLADAVKRQVEACGVTFAATAAIPVAGNAGAPSNGDVSYAIDNMASFKKQGVTTVIWPGGYETNQSAAASSIDYYPEWITWGGDHVFDEEGDAAVQNQQEWAHAWDVTSDIASVSANGEEAACAEAFLSADPSASSQDLSTYTCHLRWSFYDDIRQLFTGIQVSGPRLTPAAMDQGFHAIPQRSGSGRDDPACFYLQNDYTCVKDAMIQWWSTAAGANGYGCYRMLEAGRRFLPRSWPAGNLEAGSTSSDPCDTI